MFINKRTQKMSEKTHEAIKNQPLNKEPEISFILPKPKMNEVAQNLGQQDLNYEFN